MSRDPARERRFEAVAREVYEPLQRYLRRRANADDAGDVLADSLLTIWRRIDDVPADDPLPWCYGVARRSLANHRRGRSRTGSRSGSSPIACPPTTVTRSVGSSGSTRSSRPRSAR